LQARLPRSGRYVSAPCFNPEAGVSVETCEIRWLRRKRAEVAAAEPNEHLLFAAQPRNAGGPRLVDLHQHQRRADKRQVLAEMGPLVQPLVGILFVPEAMDLQRNRNEEANQRREALTRFHPGDDAGAPGEQHRASRGDGGLGRGHGLRAGILAHRLLVEEMVHTVVGEKPTEDHPSENEERTHTPLRGELMHSSFRPMAELASLAQVSTLKSQVSKLKAQLSSPSGAEGESAQRSKLKVDR